MSGEHINLLAHKLSHSPSIGPILGIGSGVYHALMHGGTFLYVVHNESALQEARHWVSFFDPAGQFAFLPPKIFQENKPISPRRLAERVWILYNAAHYQGIFLTLADVYQWYPPPLFFSEHQITLRVGHAFPWEWRTTLTHIFRFQRVSQVENVGDVSFKGDTLIVFPPGMSSPVRISIDDETVESIVSLNADKKPMDALTILPVGEVVLDSLQINFVQTHPSHFSEIRYSQLMEGILFNQADNYLDSFYKKPDTLWNYFPRVKQVYVPFDFLHQSEQYFSSHAGSIVPVKKWLSHIPEFTKTNPLIHKGTHIKSLPKVLQKQISLDMLFQYLSQKRNTKLIYALQSEVTFHTIRRYFIRQHNVVPAIIQHYSEAQVDTISLTYLPFEGFQVENTIIVSEPTHVKVKTNTVEIIAHTHLTNGDLVIHESYGLGKFLGLTFLDVNNTPQEFMLIEYAGRDYLYVPVTATHKVYRYGVWSEDVILDKLGSEQWSKKKWARQEEIAIVARELIEIAAHRKTLKEGQIQIHYTPYRQFTRTFPYEETKDQENIERIMLDKLTQPMPMDLLIMGNAGVGKTEIAIRATAAVVLDQKKVIVVAPTTLLADQHYRNFSKRFHSVVPVYAFTRYQSEKEKKETKQNLSKKEPCIVVGTHGLMHSGIVYNNPSLLIVDEEQYFGVMQKEKLKARFPDLNVLTMSATPIPRTLQSALSGLKDMAYIETEPVDRLPVQAQIIEKTDVLTLQNAMKLEIQRGGQIFAVCPFIANLPMYYSFITQLMPEVSIITAHGGMPDVTLEQNVQDFIQQKYQILLSTNIIESGLDIGNANTIFVFNADRFGLGQLFQLKGRVGRSPVQGYCYYMLDENATKNAVRRLHIIERHGSSYEISAQDLDMRGRGNLLGKKQTGNIKDMGIEYYERMLQDAIVHLKKKDSLALNPFVTTIELPVGAYIPKNYIKDPVMRTRIYRRISGIQTVDNVSIFSTELSERYGSIPEELMNFLRLIIIRNTCSSLNVVSIEGGMKGIRFTFYNNEFANPEGLIMYISENSDIKLSKNQSIVVPITQNKSMLDVVENFLDDLWQIKSEKPEKKSI